MLSGLGGLGDLEGAGMGAGLEDEGGGAMGGGAMGGGGAEGLKERVARLMAAARLNEQGNGNGAADLDEF